MTSIDDTAPTITFQNVTKAFSEQTNRSLFRQAFPFGPAQPGTILALDDVSFQATPGEVLGIIGPNGAGKSTLLKVAAGIHDPTAGAVTASGAVSSMIELGFSFHPNLTGWENLPLAAAILGMTDDQYEHAADAIAEFSGIEEFLDLPLKRLSTGMVARLGFALATHVPAEVLLIDEVLAVGDMAFQMRCIKRIRSMAKAGTTVLFVSHSLELVYQMCDRALCIDNGRVIDEGPVSEVIANYERRSYVPAATDGPRAARLVDVHLAKAIIDSGDHLDVSAEIEVTDVSQPLQLLSEFKDPMSHSGFVNVDLLPPGALKRPGNWRLRTSIGPIDSTAGRLELTITLLQMQPDATERFLGRSSQFFEVNGQDIGVIRLAMGSSWSFGPPNSPSLSAPPAPEPDVSDQAVAEVDAVAICSHLSKTFRHRRHDTGHVGAITPGHADLLALDDVTFSIAPGESVGLIGPNGAGKSTLLRLLAGVTEHTAGTVETRGRVASVLELSTGFHGDLSGRENAEFAWRLHGGTTQDWARAAASIDAFADIGPVLDMPVKHYSTGMAARLTLAVALELDADLLMIDEALSVGDIRFREQVRSRLADLTESGTALLFASHDLDLVGQICDRVIRLEGGSIVDDGPPHEVIEHVGGSGWSGGAATTGGSIIVKDLELFPSRVPFSQPFAVEFLLEVLQPHPAAYLEFSIRDPLMHETLEEKPTRTELLNWIEHVHRIEGIDDVFVTPGRYLVRGQLAGAPFLNTHDIVISAIDALTGDILTEHGRTTFFGAQGESAGRLEVRWSVEDGPAGT